MQQRQQQQQRVLLCKVSRWFVLCLVVGALLAATPRVAEAQSLFDVLAPPSTSSASSAELYQHAEFTLGGGFALPDQSYGMPRFSVDQDAADEVERRSLYSMSALGTDPGHSVASLGGLIIFSDSGNFIPTFNFHYLRTYDDLFDFEFRGWTIGIVSWIESGVRLALRSESASVGFRVNGLATFLLIGGESFFVGVFGLVAGVHGSFGSSGFQGTVGLDIPMPMLFTASLGSDLGSASGFTWMLRPNVAVEFPIGETNILYFVLDVLFTAESDGFPLIFSFSGGVSF